MIAINRERPFSATWHPLLKPKEHQGIFALIEKVKRVILYLPNFLIAACLNPRAATTFSYPAGINPYCFVKKIITPDGSQLIARIDLAKPATQQTPTVILFNPLGTNMGIYATFKRHLLNKQCNVICFDYRGLGCTKTAQDLVIDGESLYQYVTTELGVHQDRIHFYGFSLGGAIAAQVKALHPDSQGKYVGDRPFKSLFSLISEVCCIEKLGIVIKKITSLMATIFIAYPLYLLGWEWDGKKALSQFKGEMRILCHPQDCLVPFSASLASVCARENVIFFSDATQGSDTHFAPLEYHTTADGKAAADVVATFLAHY